MMRLKSNLLSLNAEKTVKVKVYTPSNCEEVRVPFVVDKIAKMVGQLAETAPPADQDDPRLVNGVLVQNGFKMSMMAPEDLREYAGLTTTTLTCRQRITLNSASIDLIRWALEGTFGAIEQIGTNYGKFEDNGINGETKINTETGDGAVKKEEEPADEEIGMNESLSFLVMGCVTVRYSSRTREVEVEWEGNMMNDGVADAVMAVLLTVESSPAAVKRTFYQTPSIYVNSFQLSVFLIYRLKQTPSSPS